MFFLFFSFLGLVVFLIGLMSFRQASASSKWPKMVGEVTNTIKLRSKRETQGHRSSPRLHIEYRYTVQGIEHTNDRVSYKWTKRNVAEDQKIYLTGKPVDVYVDPDDAQEAVLEPGVDYSNYMALLTGMLFIIGGLVAAVFVKT